MTEYGLMGDGYEKIFLREMEVAKQTNFIRFHGTGKYSREKAYCDVNCQINSPAKGILKTVREEEGGSYGVSVFSGFSIAPYEKLLPGHIF